ncbi:ATP-binding protein, partial [Acinetobacter baumannii]|nr:ATP-binding protein [Acinetobacter baumannii]
MVKLKSLHLENIQSWEDATIEFGPGLNAIIANNNVGKSVVFKTLRITCNPEFFAKPERAKLV